jgi:hypothetical protein
MRRAKRNSEHPATAGRSGKLKRKRLFRQIDADDFELRRRL